MSQLRLALLGTLRIQLEDISVAVGSNKATALLIYLAVSGSEQRRDSLSTLLWPNHDQATARTYLRHTLWLLNKAGLKSWLATTRDTVRLKVGYQLDVATFRFLARSGAWAAAADLYRDDFLTGFSLADSGAFDDWQSFQSQELRHRFAQVLSHLIKQKREQARYDEALHDGRRWLSLDPLNEVAHRQLMQLHALMGNQSAALLQYQQCQQLLTTELGVSPSAKTITLFQAIRDHQFGAASSSETRSAKLASGSAASQAISPPAHNLTPQATPFIGRQAELAALEDLLANPDNRLVTIVGAGGMGKTRLALAWAWLQVDARARFPHGVFVINLAPLSEAEQIVPALADALDIPLQAQDSRSAQQQLLDYLNKKKLLLLLDNFEQLLAPPIATSSAEKEGGEEIVTDILRAARDVQILVTSRERLNLQAERVYPIGGLVINAGECAAPEVANKGEDRRSTGDTEIEHQAAVALFLQSARRNRPDFAPADQQGWTDLIQICTQVSGMPLAIELAAAWTDKLTLSDIVAELQRGLDFLVTERRDMPKRHRSIRAVIASSWQQLSQEERVVFAKLSVFRSPFKREAAEAVAAANMHHLATLVTKSLMQFNQTKDHYEVHELIRQFGEEQLERMALTSDTQRTYAVYFLGFLQQREAEVKGGRQLAAFAEIRATLPHIRVAWSWAARFRMSALLEKGLTTLVIYFEKRYRWGAFDELRRQALSMLTPRQDESPPSVWYHLVSWHAHLIPWGPRPSASDLAAVEQALAYARQQDEPGLLIICLRRWTRTLIASRELDSVPSLIEEGLNLTRQLHDRYEESEWLLIRFNYHWVVGELDRAIALNRQAITFMAAHGDKLGVSDMHLNLSRISLWDRGDFAQAESEIRQVIDFYREIGQRHIVAFNQIFMGYIAFLRGELDEMAAWAKAGGDVLHEFGGEFFLDHARCLLGLLAIAQERYSEAMPLLEQGAHLAYNSSWEPFLRSWGLTMSAFGQGDFAAARTQFHRALDYALSPPRRGPLAMVIPLAVLITAHDGRSERAVELLALACTSLAPMNGLFTNVPLFAPLFADLEAACGTAMFKSAYKHGESLPLRQTVESLLSELAT